MLVRPVKAEKIIAFVLVSNVNIVSVLSVELMCVLKSNVLLDFCS